MDSIGDKTKQAKEWGGEKLSQIKGAVGKALNGYRIKLET